MEIICLILRVTFHKNWKAIEVEALFGKDDMIMIEYDMVQKYKCLFEKLDFKQIKEGVTAQKCSNISHFDSYQIMLAQHTPMCIRYNFPLSLKEDNGIKGIRTTQS